MMKLFYSDNRELRELLVGTKVLTDDDEVQAPSDVWQKPCE